MAISPFVYAKLPYDPVKDLTPITLAATAWFFVVTNPSSPLTSITFPGTARHMGARG